MEPTVLPQRSEVRSGRLLRNTVATGLTQAVSAVVTFALTPYLLHRLGPAEYGVWLLALGVSFTAGYVAIADLGFSEATMRLIARDEAGVRPAGTATSESRSPASTDDFCVSQIVSTIVCATTVLGIVLAAALAAAAPLLVDAFGVPTALQAVAQTAFALMSLEVAFELPALGLRAVANAAQRVALLRAVDLSGRLGWAAAAVGAVAAGGGVRAMALAAVVVAIVRLVIVSAIARRLRPDLAIRPRHVRWTVLRTTMTYGSIIGALQLLSVIYGQMDRFIIGARLGAAPVASYEIVFRINSLATLALSVATAAVLPAAALNAARSDDTRQRELYLRGTRYNVALALPVVIAAMLSADDLLTLWVGAEYRSLAGTARLFLVFSVFAVANQVGVSMLIGMGRGSLVLRCQAASVGTNLAVSLALVGTHGIRGVVIGTVVGGLVVWPVYLRVLLREFQTRIGEWASRILVSNLPGVVAQVAVVIAARTIRGGPESLLALAVTAAVGILASFTAFGLIAGREERRHVVSRLVKGDRIGDPPN